MTSNQRVAVVTGSSSGNGYETSLILARNATVRNLIKGENGFNQNYNYSSILDTQIKLK